MNWTGKQVLVVGCGISGIGSARLLEKMEAVPILYDENIHVKVEHIREKFSLDEKIQIVIGRLPKETEEKIEMVVLSPGVPSDTEFADRFRKRNIPVIGEIELAYLCGNGRLIAITGTNGKTTTTSLIHKVLRNKGYDVTLIGTNGVYFNDDHYELNNTTPSILELYSIFYESKKRNIKNIIMEVSSHAIELKRIEGIKFDIIGFTNISHDHLDFHKTIENYAKAKYKLTNYLKKDGLILGSIIITIGTILFLIQGFFFGIDTPILCLISSISVGIPILIYSIINYVASRR